MVADHILMIFILIFLSMLGMPFIKTGIMEVKHEKSFLENFYNINIFSVLGMALYISKDLINGQSLGKRIFNLQLVNNSTNEPASPLVGIIRNLFILIWPIELIILSINPSRRIGDYLMRTKVIPFNPTSNPKKPNIIKIFISILIPFIFFLFLVLSKNEILQILNPNKLEYKEGSLNIELSESLSEEFPLVFNEVVEDSLIISADCCFYNKSRIDTSIFYMSAIINLTDNYLANSDDFETMKTVCKTIFDEILEEDTYNAKVQFVFKDLKTFKIHKKQFQIKSSK